MTSTKYNPRVYWTYPDADVYDITRSALDDIVAAHPTFAFATQLDRLHDGDYVIVGCLCNDGSNFLAMSDSFDDFERAQEAHKMLTCGNWLYVTDDTQYAGYVQEYEVWHVVADPVENTEDEPDAFSQMCGLAELLPEFDGASSDDVQAFCEGYAIGVMAVLEATSCIY